MTLSFSYTMMSTKYQKTYVCILLNKNGSEIAKLSCFLFMDSTIICFDLYDTFNCRVLKCHSSSLLSWTFLQLGLIFSQMNGLFLMWDHAF